MPLPDPVIEKLVDIVGAKNVLITREDLIPYAFDGTAVLKESPGCVAFASNTGQISEALKLANETGIPIVTRGSGTGLSGGSVPSADCIVLCTVKMDKILEVDTANLNLTAEPGVTTTQIAEAAEEVGLFYPPDPGSMKISTIGGNVAENSGGLRGLKYGVTRNYVMGMEVVLPDGEVMRLGNKCVKDVAGFSLKDVMIGSEGTLGVITKVLLRLIPKPAAKKTMVATFDAMDAAAQTVSDIIAAQIIPCTLEFLDRTTIHCVEDFAKVGLPLDCEALLLMETDGHPAAVAEEASKMEELAKANGAMEVRVARDAAEAAQLATARRSAFSALARLAPTTILEDATVPRSELAHMIRFVAEVAKKHELKIGTFGHMGDGNLHLCINLGTPPSQPPSKTIDEVVYTITGRHIGSISAEHGLGRLRREEARRYKSDVEMDLMQKVKVALDPGNIMNPGKVV